ncbi:MobQ family relaxase [Oscillospiraceae bacterium MB24-C1]|nr:MobQ family relaxase [Oscillospiraceae bacterium MB24-C1]
MALYSFHGQIIGRGRSIKMNQDGSVSEKAASRRSTSVAAAAYRAGTRLIDERTGEVYDYTRKGGVVHTEIMLPTNAPGRYHDRQRLWNAVELAERQSNAQLSRELRIALPGEFTREENIALVRDFVQKNFVAKGMCADVAYHIKDKGGKDHNPHVHIMLTMRPMTKSGTWWKTKSRKEYITDRNGDRITGANGEWKSRNVDLTGWNDKTLYVSWRAQWADACNECYEAKGLPYRVDHRSYIEQGIHRQPTMHMGKEATALERKGVSTEKGNYNRTVAACNEMADLGIEPTGLWETAQSIFEQAKARQRRSRKARVSEPTLAGRGEAKAAEGRPQRPEVAQSGGQSGPSVRSQDAQRRTDAPLHGAVRQGAPCTPEKDESRPLSSEKKPPQRLETPTTDAVGERSHAPDRAAWQHEPDALRNARQIRSAIRQTVGTHNFLATRGVESYGDIVAGVRLAQSNHAACRDELIRTQAEIDQLQSGGVPEIQQLRELEKCARWCNQHRDVAEQFEKLKLFRGRFYQNHKNEIDKFNYASKKLQAAGYNHHILPEAFKRDIAELEARQAYRLKALANRLDSLIPKLDELREELRIWSAAEVYMRELLDLPDPEQSLPDFSVPSGREDDSIQAKLQRVSDLAHERKQKVPATKHRHDDKGR